MNTPHSLSVPRPGPNCAAFEPLLPLAKHHLLEPEEERKLQAHLADCPHCRARLAAYDRLDDVLRRRFEQIALPPLHIEDIMQEIEDQEKETPLPPLRPHARVRASKLFSWMGAIAAVLAIALITTALVASHRSPAPHNGSSPSEPSTPGVYFSATTTGSSQQTFIYALNPTNGSLRWHSPMPTNGYSSPVLVDHGVLYGLTQDFGANSAPPKSDATPTANPPKPAIEDRNRSGTANSIIYALRTSDGKQLWHTSFDAIVTLPLAVVNGVVYAGTETGTLYALNASNGSVKWHITPGNNLFVDRVVDSVVYVSEDDTASANTATGKLLALNASNGSVKWSFDLQGPAQRVQVFNGQVGVFDYNLVIGSHGDIIPAGHFSMLNASDGSVKWRYQGDPTKVKDAFVEQGNVYISLGDSLKGTPTTTLQALNASDGALRWQKTYTSFNILRPEQGVGNGKVYVAADNASIFALNAQDGSEAWHAQISNSPYPYGLMNGTLYVEAGAELYALNADTGAELWRAQPEIYGGLLSVSGGGMLYGIAKVVDAQGKWGIRLFAIDAQTGKELWHYDATLSSGPIIVG